VEALLDSGVTGLVMSSEFPRKNKFRKKKLDRPIYIRNIDSTFKKINVIEGQCYNSRLKVLSQKKNLVLELIQENSMKFQVQKCLSYIY